MRMLHFPASRQPGAGRARHAGNNKGTFPGRRAIRGPAASAGNLSGGTGAPPSRERIVLDALAPGRGSPSPRPAYHERMSEPGGWSGAERAGALVLLLVACGLAAIAGDILFGNRFLTRGGCCDDQEPGDDG